MPPSQGGCGKEGEEVSHRGDANGVGAKGGQNAAHQCLSQWQLSLTLAHRK